MLSGSLSESLQVETAITFRKLLLSDLEPQGSSNRSKEEPNVV